MSVFELIESALKADVGDDPILTFGRFQITQGLGSGEQGEVVKAIGPVGKEFAIKFYRPIRSSVADKEGVQNFQREVKTLVSMYHSNIVKVYTGGTAMFNRNKWFVTEGFDAPLRDNTVLYYVMDHVNRRLDDDDMFPELKSDLDKICPPATNPADNAMREKAERFERMVVQLTSAMVYYHDQQITHKDIKPDNIRFSAQDSTFVFVDFGFARHIKSTQDKNGWKRVRCMDWPAIIKGKYDLADIGSLAMILRAILPSLTPIYQGWRYNGLLDCINRALSGDLNERAQNVKEFGRQLRRFFTMMPAWNLTVAMNEYLTPSHFGRFTSKIRLPVSSFVRMTKEVAAIVDTSEFQRLRGVRQLGPTIFVFPGANHTRFEHSLGTYDLSLKYLERVLRCQHGRYLDENLDHSIRLVVLAALLHDIGHYPYSHWVEEIGEFPSGIKFPQHEDRARKFIVEGQLSQLIKKEWQVDPENVACVISGKKLGSNMGLVLANSFIDSAIDVDKVDYLVRDSVHCGVDYGRGIDIEQLFDSLYVDIENTRLSITDKGLTPLLSLITCRNIMYEAVYWHKTVRACEAMFKRFFYEVVSQKHITVDEIEKYFLLSDDAFTRVLYDRVADNAELQQLMTPFVFQGRSIYKPAYMFNAGSVKGEPADTATFFSKALGRTGYRELVEMSKKLAKKLSVQPHEILIETTPTDKEQKTSRNLQELIVWNSRKNAPRSVPRGIGDAIDYLNRNRKAYLFCHPRHYEKIALMAREGKLDKLFGEMLS